jgi:hypothetical protein
MKAEIYLFTMGTPYKINSRTLVLASSGEGTWQSNVPPPRHSAMVSSSPNLRKRKNKPRASLACDTCRAKKSKCDQGFLCQICKGRRSTFVFGLAWFDLCWTRLDREIPCVYGEKRTKPAPNNSLSLDKLSVLSVAASTRAHQKGSSPAPQQQHQNFELHLAPETHVSSTNGQGLQQDTLRNDNVGLSTGSGNDAVAAINH